MEEESTECELHVAIVVEEEGNEIPSGGGEEEDMIVLEEKEEVKEEPTQESGGGESGKSAITLEEKEEMKEEPTQKSDWTRRFVHCMLITMAIIFSSIIWLFVTYPDEIRGGIRNYLNLVSDHLTLVAILLLLWTVFYFSITMGGGVLAPTIGGATLGIVAWPICWLGIIIGTSINLWLVRTCCRPVFSRWLKRKKKGAKLLQKMSKTARFIASLNPKQIFWMMAGLRSPLFFTGLMNYAFAFSEIHVQPYLLGSCVGFAPGSLVYVLLGDAGLSLLGAIVGDGVEIWLVIVEGMCGVLMLGVAFRIFRRIRRFPELQEVSQQQIEVE